VHYQIFYITLHYCTGIFLTSHLFDAGQIMLAAFNCSCQLQLIPLFSIFCSVTQCQPFLPFLSFSKPALLRSSSMQFIRLFSHLAVDLLPLGCPNKLLWFCCVCYVAHLRCRLFVNIELMLIDCYTLLLEPVVIDVDASCLEANVTV